MSNKILELAREISLASLGSNHTLFLPHFNTEEANLFYTLSPVIIKILDIYKYLFNFKQKFIKNS